MIAGVSVTVSTPTVLGVDRLNNPIYGAPSTATVDNVLISPGATADLEAARPEGVSVDYTLHFPKTFTGDLEGATVTLPAPWTGVYKVVGKPTPYILANTPTPWCMAVEVAAAHG